MQYKEGELCVSGLEKLGPWQSELKHSFLSLVFLKAGFLILCCLRSPRLIHLQRGCYKKIIPEVPWCCQYIFSTESKQIKYLLLGSLGITCLVHLCLPSTQFPLWLWSRLCLINNATPSPKYKSEYAPKPAYIYCETFEFHGKVAPRAQREHERAGKRAFGLANWLHSEIWLSDS